MRDPRFHDDPSSALPCAGGLLAGTLALMTGWAECSDGARRVLMARKIASNLFFLREHPQLPGGLRLVVAKVHAHWVELAAAAPPAGSAGVAAAALASGPWH
jgi:hypothetical protein